MHRIVLPLERVLQAADRKSGCTAAQLSILAAVQHFGATTLNRLAAHERIAAPTASRIVEGLVREGLLTRKAQADDRRAVRLEVTGKGIAAMQVACDAREAALAEALTGLSPDEQAALVIVVPALNRVLGLGPDAVR